MASEEKKIAPINNKSLPILTKYEKAKIIGTRAAQISSGSPIFVDVSGLSNPLEMAEKELKEGKTPLIIRRKMPDGTFETFKVSDLKI